MSQSSEDRMSIVDMVRRAHVDFLHKIHRRVRDIDELVYEVRQARTRLYYMRARLKLERDTGGSPAAMSYFTGFLDQQREVVRANETKLLIARREHSASMALELRQLPDLPGAHAHDEQLAQDETHLIAEE